MKKLMTFLLAFAAAGTLWCSATDVKYDIKGTGAPKDGATVYQVDQVSLARIDSAVVSHGAFQMKGKAEKDAFLAIAIPGDQTPYRFLRSGQIPLFNDGKPVTVTAAFKKYHKKGFEVVGLSFDKDKDAWVQAIKDWDMPWIHLSDLKHWQTVAAGVYSVNSIPDNLLIDPQGNIVARGLRGQELEAKLAEIFK